MRCLIICFLFLLPNAIWAQSSGFSKLSIGNTGCAFYSPGEMSIESAYSQDSSIVYSGENYADSFHYFIIMVEIKDPIPDSIPLQESLLINYLDYLKSSFSITESAGYGRGHTLPGYDKAIGILDYWQDEFGDSWSVKGWTDGRILAILGIYGASPFPNISQETFYLNGFRFPGM